MVRFEDINCKHLCSSLLAPCYKPWFQNIDMYDYV